MKFKNIFVSLILSAVFCTNAFAYEGVNLNINGKDITSEVAPRLINERTMVPVRAILEEIGASVNWNEEQKTVTAEKGNIKFSMALLYCKWQSGVYGFKGCCCEKQNTCAS